MCWSQPPSLLRKSLLYAIGAPIEPGDNINTTHDAVISAVQTLYDTYKGLYGWENLALQIDWMQAAGVSLCVIAKLVRATLYILEK